MRSDFTQQAEVIENYSLLQRIGVFSEIDAHKKRIGELEELLKLAGEIFSQTSLEGLLEFVVDGLSDKFIPEKLMFILQDRQNKIRYFGFQNLRPYDFHIQLESLEPFESFFIQYPGTINFELFEFTFENPGVTQQLQHFHPEVVVPIVGLNGLYGVILVGPKYFEPHYSDEEIMYIDTLMKFTSISIQNNFHYLSAVTDSKTHLYNHVFFMKRLGEEIENAQQFQLALGVIVLDIDHFKKFNDSYGHLAGDMVISHIANILSRSLRRGDVAARFGGEEFTVMLPKANRHQTWQIAERLRKAICSSEVEYQGQILQVSASFGCSAIHPLNLVNSDSLLEQADNALYTSKNRGRNRSTVYRPGLLVSATIVRETQGIAVLQTHEHTHIHELASSAAIEELPSATAPAAQASASSSNEDSTVEVALESPIAKTGAERIEDEATAEHGIWDHCPD